MLLGKQQRLEELLVQVLARTPARSAKQLHAEVLRTRDSISIQAVYQALGRLEDDGVLIKQAKQYSLGLHWVLDLASFIDQVYDRYTEPDVLGPLPDKDTSVQTWEFHSIAAIVPFWTHMVLCMAQASEERLCYEYVDHIWFHLCSAAVESKFLRAVQGLGLRHAIVIGGTGYLDRLYQEEVEAEAVELHFGAEDFSLSKEHYLSCVGPYVLRVRLRKDMLEYIEDFYQSISSTNAVQAGRIAEFVHTRSKLRLSVEYNEAKAEKLRRIFQRFFGHS